MTRDLHEKIGSVTPENLFAGLDPRALTKAGVLRKLGTAATLVRGTLLAKSSGSAGDDKLVILGSTAATNETLTAYGILCDDTEVGTSADVNALVYLAGSFDPDRLIVKENYTMTAADIDALRNGGIILKAQIDADYVQSN